MSLYLVRDGDREVWVAAEREGRMFTYVANTGRFQRNKPVGSDFLMEREMAYEPLTPEQARAKMDAGVGRLDERTMGPILDQFRADDAEYLSVEDVFGAQPQQVPQQPNRRARARALADAVNEAQPGQWVTWRTYPPDRRQTAQVAAHDLKNGKIRALGDLPVDTRIVPTTDETGLVVQITRAA